MEERQRHREVLAINRAIAGARGHEEVLRLVVERSVAITGAIAGLLLLEGADGRARVVRSAGLDQARAAAVAIPLSEHLDEELCAQLGLEAGEGFVGVPVIGEAGLKGVLAVYFHPPQEARRESDEEVLSALADQAAIALERADRLQALETSERRFRALADEAPVGIFQADPMGHSVYLNHLGREMSGQPPTGALSTNWHHSIHPEDRERVVLEWRVAAAQGRSSSSEYRLLGPDGRPVLVRAYARALRDVQDQVTGYIGVIVDVRETRALRTHVALAARLATIGSLVTESLPEVEGSAAGLHTLQVRALAAAQAARKRLHGEGPLDRAAVTRALDETVQLLARAQEVTDRIAGLIKGLSTSASAELGEARIRLRLHDVVSQAIHWLPASVMEAAAIKIEDKGAPEIKASAFQIEQVVVNLVSNATRAARAFERSKVVIRLGPGAPGMARLEVVDRGSGIDPRSLERLFEQQPGGAAAPGDGAGLGLALSHAIVTAHGGSLTVVSAPGRGSTFRVELPAA
jgi:PAS domain S-box-containing protein